MKLKKLALGVAVALGVAAPASAHVWNIGWKSTAGSLTFYGVSYHGGAVGGSGTVDDFSANPAGFVINGSNVGFENGSVVNLNDCSGPGGLLTGACDSAWDALNLDGVLHASGYSSNTYGKYASVTLNSTELAGLGISSGSNSVLLSTFANNAHWDGLGFSSATVPLNIVVTPPPAVPLPAGLPLVLSGLGAFGFLRARRKA
ncbi:VPLPA-CTERM sorting domain-containing protein [Pseudooceanicola nitratireducens]|uniref:VPLPA-CTERM sorting domain-containing protein n=1 Tax=Pseudooceanicola nitratireducens TaxID=517719 RepID=UPI0035120963